MRPMPTASPMAISLNTPSSAPSVDCMSSTRFTTSLPMSSITAPRNQVSTDGFGVRVSEPQRRESGFGSGLRVDVCGGAIMAAAASTLHLEQAIEIEDVDGARRDALDEPLG